MKKIAIISLKGGVGKTTIAAGLAQALHQMGYKVGALDVDFSAPNLHIVLNCDGCRPGRATGDVIVPVERDGIKVLSWGMIFPSQSAITIEDKQIEPEDLRQAVSWIREGKEEKAITLLTELADHPGGATEHMRLLLRPGAIAWGEIDFLILDTPPNSTGVIRVALEAELDGVIIVTHPSRVSLADTGRTLDLFRKEQIPIYGVISNQGTQQGLERYDLRDQDVIDLANKNALPFALTIPHENDLASHFQNLADKILTVQPIRLPMREIAQESHTKFMQMGTRMGKALRVFIGGEEKDD